MNDLIQIKTAERIYVDIWEQTAKDEYIEKKSMLTYLMGEIKQFESLDEKGRSLEYNYAALDTLKKVYEMIENNIVQNCRRTNNE
ncbi:MAG: hypothetical protein ACOCVF_02940 [bacterium]